MIFQTRNEDKLLYISYQHQDNFIHYNESKDNFIHYKRIEKSSKVH